ncbi:MAG: methyltransferase domain-containing protein [Candidatus Aminicenantia bacterium]
MDITDIPFPDNHFDCIICCHVLEHVPDDRKAMRELFRILKPGGWAILQSPINLNRDKTFEDPNIVSSEERERVFGQSDHVRIYGRDFKNKLEEVGFVVRVDNYVQKLGDSVIKKYGLMRNEKIYFCLKHELWNYIHEKKLFIDGYKHYLKKMSINIKVVNRCNLHCKICDIVQQQSSKTKEIHIKKIKKLIDEASELGATRLHTTGGEPIIRKDILEIVNYAKKLGFKKITLDTNGRMFSYKDFCEDLNLFQQRFLCGLRFLLIVGLLTPPYLCLPVLEFQVMFPWANLFYEEEQQPFFSSLGDNRYDDFL